MTTLKDNEDGTFDLIGLTSHEVRYLRALLGNTHGETCWDAFVALGGWQAQGGDTVRDADEDELGSLRVVDADGRSL